MSRYYRNRRLGEFLKELDLSEGHSSGIPTIQEELEKNGSPRAEFFTDDDRRAMRIMIPIHPSFLEDVDNLDGTNQVTNQESNQVSGAETGTREVKILEFCKEPKTRAEIQEYVGINNRGHFRTAILDPLLKNGKLLRTIPDKPNSKNQKYITAKK